MIYKQKERNQKKDEELNIYKLYSGRNSFDYGKEFSGLTIIPFKELVDENGFYKEETEISYHNDNGRVVALNLKEGVTSIEAKAFKDSLKLVVFNSCPTLKKIGEEAFYNCKEFKLINLNPGLEEIGDKAFYGCTSLDHITIPGTVKKLGKDIFAKTSLSSIFTTKEVAEKYLENNKDSRRPLEIFAYEKEKMYVYKIPEQTQRSKPIRCNVYNWPYGITEMEKIYQYNTTYTYNGKTLKAEACFMKRDGEEWKYSPIPHSRNKTEQESNEITKEFGMIL